MSEEASGVLHALLREHESTILQEWMRLQGETPSLRGDLIPESELRRQSMELLGSVIAALKSGAGSAMDAAEWETVRSVLRGIADRRAQLGFSPAESAAVILALKRPIFERLQAQHAADAESAWNQFWYAFEILDHLALYCLDVTQGLRDAVIQRQQDEILELSTPVIRLWNGILAIPLIGTLDSARTQVVMESLLQQIVDTESDVAIIDITGVPMVDTAVAQHLLKTVEAARLMGAECFISGIRPQIAQTIVQLGLDLGDIVTKASLADAFRAALRFTGQRLEPR